ncbi:DUF2627 domain-containing protein [Camelliibacillus cellulosilyticus]|uniref:DUF2627 domain-containing protein n=1 Tax=Camelliibacillus cellulosilyticus TaxID=2174486 RepID=A0ABV9GI21_9BACL
MLGRLIALLFIIIPCAFAAVGVKLMRDTVFAIVNAPFPWLWLQFVSGIAFFAIGIGFIGGWVVYRDRKRNYTYRKQVNARRKPTQNKRPSQTK